MKDYIFGYGSLVGSCGVNGRGMMKRYEPYDLVETYLRDYTRHLNSGPANSGLNFYGIDPCSGGKINGVLFEIATEDISFFLRSEGFNAPPSMRPYRMVDVTSKITAKVKGKVWTCESTRNNKGTVRKNYYWRVAQALKERSEKFNKEFTPFDKNWVSMPDYFDYDMWD